MDITMQKKEDSHFPFHPWQVIDHETGRGSRYPSAKDAWKESYSLLRANGRYIFFCPRIHVLMNGNTKGFVYLS